MTHPIDSYGGSGVGGIPSGYPEGLLGRSPQHGEEPPCGLSADPCGRSSGQSARYASILTGGAEKVRYPFTWTNTLAYVEFADHDPTSTLLTLPRVLVTRTFSKAWGLPGLRVG